MDAALIKSLIEGENSIVEFKKAAPRPAELAERICGFANGMGGYIVIGVTDTDWQVVGVRYPNNTIDTLLQAVRLCRPTVRVGPDQPQVVEVDGKKLVVLYIPPNTGTLYQAGGVFWIRRGTHTIPLEADEIENFFHNRGSLKWDTRAVPEATLDLVDDELVRSYREGRAQRTRESDRLGDTATMLKRLNCATMMRGENGRNELRLTNTGLLLFSYSPQLFLLQAEVICVLFGDNTGLRRYIDRQDLQGSLTRQIDQAERFFRKNIAVAARIEGFRRIDEPQYPLEALREAVINAVVHRDYSLAGEAVRIFFYQDRIEVHSPGYLVPGLRLEELAAGHAPSRPRNETIASVLRDFPGGYMERIGSGINFMLEQMHSLGKPAPEFKLQNEFVVTFRGQSEFNERTGTKVDGYKSESRIITKASVEAASNTTLTETAEQEGLTGGEHEPLSQAERQEKALRYIQAHGSITNREYRQITGASDSTALRDLEMLLKQNTIRAVGGSRRSRRYEMI